MREQQTEPETQYPWGTDKPWFAYADYNRKKFGKRIQKISVNGGFTCPNRDGTVAYGGCTYCNNDSFSPPHLDPAESIRSQVADGLKFMKKRYKTDRFIAYFQAYSNTYAPLEHLKTLYEAALDFDEVIGLTIGTRPDCVDRDLLAYLSKLAERHYITIEYGLESMHDQTLESINRGHTFQQWKDAVAMTREYSGIHICAHVILGLPGETREMMLQNAEAVNDANVDYLKLHQLHIVKGTVMAAQYRKNPFPLFSFEEYVRLVVDFLERLDPRIAIQRLFGEAHPRILIAPKWNVKPAEMVKAVTEEFKRRKSRQGTRFSPRPVDPKERKAVYG